jgi:hypothetical protein
MDAEQSYKPICTWEGGEPQGSRKGRPRYPLEGRREQADASTQRRIAETQNSEIYVKWNCADQLYGPRRLRTTGSSGPLLLSRPVREHLMEMVGKRVRDAGITCCVVTPTMDPRPPHGPAQGV